MATQTLRRSLTAGVLAAGLSLGLLSSGALAAPAHSTVAPSSSPGAAGDVHIQSKASTTLYIQGANARVWKTWYRYSGGGYKGHFGASRVNGADVYAHIYWNSGRYQFKKLKPGKSYVYYGAKKVLLQLCGDYECSGKW
ncbi:hypothetical protein ACQB60_20450 [Actinomycetota bacterium Odt1-20B]